jgi:hypothetical protein
MRPHVPVLLLALLTACGPDFELQSEIRRVRVLAIRAEPAELVLDPNGSLPPQPVTFNALAVSADDAPVTVTYALCRFSGNPYDGRCPGDTGVPLPEGVLSLQDPNVQAVLREALEAQEPGDGPVDPNDPALLEALQEGIPLFVGYEATDGRGTPEGTERGVRRVTLRAAAAPNQNPAVSDILWEGASLSGPLPVGQEVTFQPVLTEGSAEVYETADGARTEQVFYSWFATGDGEVKEFRSLEPVDGRPGDPTSKYETPDAPGRITFWVVARRARVSHPLHGEAHGVALELEVLAGDPLHREVHGVALALDALAGDDSAEAEEQPAQVAHHQRGRQLAPGLQDEGVLRQRHRAGGLGGVRVAHHALLQGMEVGEGLLQRVEALRLRAVKGLLDGGLAERGQGGIAQLGVQVLEHPQVLGHGDPLVVPHLRDAPAVLGKQQRRCRVEHGGHDGLAVGAQNLFSHWHASRLARTREGPLPCVGIVTHAAGRGE